MRRAGFFLLLWGCGILSLELFFTPVLFDLQLYQASYVLLNILVSFPVNIGFLIPVVMLICGIILLLRKHSECK